MAWAGCVAYPCVGAMRRPDNWGKRLVETPMPFLFSSTNLIIITNLAEFGSCMAIMNDYERVCKLCSTVSVCFYRTANEQYENNSFTITLVYCCDG